MAEPITLYYRRPHFTLLDANANWKLVKPPITITIKLQLHKIAILFLSNNRKWRREEEEEEEGLERGSFSGVLGVCYIPASSLRCAIRINCLSSCRSSSTIFLEREDNGRQKVKTTVISLISWTIQLFKHPPFPEKMNNLYSKHLNTHVWNYYSNIRTPTPCGAWTGVAKRLQESLQNSNGVCRTSTSLQQCLQS